jgi:hypothetical protein
VKDFFGHAVITASNDRFEVVGLTDVGPRIVGLFAKGVEGNLLAETPDIAQDTPHGKMSLLGGHRLWEAPELKGISGLPDAVVKAESHTDGFTLAAEPNAIGLRKSMRVSLEADKVRVKHIIKNDGRGAIELAPWAITQLPIGGVFVPAVSGSENESKLPDRNVVYWSYSNANKNGIGFNKEGLRFAPNQVQIPFKFGTFVQAGWARIDYPTYSFVKKFNAEPGNYPDRSCNFEVYVADDYVELESLAPLVNLKPGDEVSHLEIWEIHAKTA